MSRVIVYSTANCSFCNMTKVKLEQWNIPFEDVRIDQDATAMEEFMEKTARRVKRALTLGCQSKNHNVVYSFENEILQQQPVRAS